MDYKYLLHIALLLISNPAKAWEEIRLRPNINEVSFEYVYPMIGFSALSVFLGAIFDRGWADAEDYKYAMIQCASVVVSLFGAYFLSSYLINMVRVRILKQRDDMLLSQQFAGYSMTVIFLLQIVTGILPDLGIISMMLQFYIIYLVWEGTEKMPEMKEEDRTMLTIIASAILLACPPLIRFVFDTLNILLN
ncbi:MAG: YIP1 family protein [Bacteroidaceae bacterium]|nr:YIP1 family protein [Bacteroidaceae bacterium]